MMAENKPTLREWIASKAESTWYKGDHPVVWLEIADQIHKIYMDWFKEELSVLTVIGSDEKYARSIARLQLSHTINQLKERLG
jgi:hypothetical protein